MAQFEYDDRSYFPGGQTLIVRYDFDSIGKKRIIRAFVPSPNGSVAKFDILPN